MASDADDGQEAVDGPETAEPISVVARPIA